jgi:hypothetical protein
MSAKDWEGALEFTSTTCDKCGEDNIASQFISDHKCQT